MKTHSKLTNGTVQQIFDDEGNLLSQEFKADDMAFASSEKCLDFQAPFEMVQPKPIIQIVFTTYSEPTLDGKLDQLQQTEISIPYIENELLKSTVQRAFEAINSKFDGKFAFTEDDMKRLDSTGSRMEIDFIV